MIVKVQTNIHCTNRKRKNMVSKVKKGSTNPLYEMYLETHKNIPSKDVDPAHIKENDSPIYEGKLAKREELAQRELAAKRMRTAPPYSKGAYQYISDLDIQFLGRKV